jgi:hypothetical protein
MSGSGSLGKCGENEVARRRARTTCVVVYEETHPTKVLVNKNTDGALHLVRNATDLTS